MPVKHFLNALLIVLSGNLSALGHAGAGIAPQTLQVMVKHPLPITARTEANHVRPATPDFSVPVVVNTYENTRAVYPDDALTAYIARQPNASSKMEYSVIHDLLNTVRTTKSKTFVVSPKYAPFYLRALNTRQPNYSNDLVKKLHLLYANLNTTTASLSSDYRVEILSATDHTRCAEVSAFQQTNLAWFRQLPAEVNANKIRTRYALIPFRQRISSADVYVFTIRNQHTLLGTLTLNVHRRSDVAYSNQFGYLSDLFVASGLDQDPVFIRQFIGGVWATIRASFPELKTVVIMAATDDRDTPILKSLLHAQAAGLLQPFGRELQASSGTVAHFINE